MSDQQHKQVYASREFTQPGLNPLAIDDLPIANDARDTTSRLGWTEKA